MDSTIITYLQPKVRTVTEQRKRKGLGSLPQEVFPSFFCGACMNFDLWEKWIQVGAVHQNNENL
mgnify:CR=1 FL=1